MDDLEQVRIAVEEIAARVGVPALFAGVAIFLRTADLSCGGETGRRQADVVDAIANWEW